MAEVVNTNQFRNGMHIGLDGGIWRIVEFPRVHTEVKNMQYLYESGDEVVFMDQETYEQTALPRESVSDAIDFMEPSSSVQMLTVDGEPAGVQLPASVELTVSETEPGVRGDTVSNVTKPATLETGA